MTKCTYWDNRYIPVEYSFDSISNENNIYFTLCLISKGTAVLNVNGEKCYISAPILICANPDFTIEIIKSNNTNIKSIFFAPEFINRNLSAKVILDDDYDLQCKLFSFPNFDIFYNTSDLFKGIIPVEVDALAKLEYIFDTTIEQMAKQPDNMWSCRARMSILKIFDFASTLYNEAFVCNIENETLVDCVLNYIEFNYDKKISLTDLSKWNNTNRTTLANEFKKVTGQTISEFITNKRIDMSSQILCFTNIPVEEIALKCGFDSQSYFAKTFKKKMGVSPTTYRKNQVAERIKMQCEVAFNSGK